MHIELASTLTKEDENKLAPALMKALAGMLDMLPIAYAIRVETTDQSIQEISLGTPGLTGADVGMDLPPAIEY